MIGMRKLFGLRFAALIVFLCTISAGSPCNAGTLRIYVADFEVPGNVKEDQWFGLFIADSIENNLKILPEVRLVHATESELAARSKNELNNPLPPIFKEAETAKADFAIGGEVRRNGKALSIDAYVIRVDELEKISKISFVCDVSTLYSRLDYLSVSIAQTMEIACSDEQAASMKRIPTASLEAMAFYGEALASLPESRDRRLLLLKALAEDRGYTDALSKLGLYYFQARRFAEAQKILERLADVQPDYPYLNYNLGLVHGSRRQYSQAISKYQKALTASPQDSDILNNLGRIYFMMGQHERATETFVRALEARPDDPNALANLKKLNREVTENLPAKSEPAAPPDPLVPTESADEQDDSRYADELAKLGRNYLKRKMYAKAQESLEKLETVRTDYPHLYYNLGLVHSSKKQYARAIEMYKKALISLPDDSDTWNNIGITYYALGRHDEATDALERALKAKPDDPNALANLDIIRKKHPQSRPQGSHLAKNINVLKQHVETGAAHYAAGDFWRAAEEFAKALDLHPDNFKANNNIALAYEKIGETKKAKKHFERALDIDPTAIDVSENLSRLKQNEQRRQSGPVPDEPSLPSSPDPDTLIALGKVHLSRESYAEAAEAFSGALDSSPDNIDALNGLGAAFFSVGRYERAGETFRKALSVDPENVTARQNLADTEFVMETLRASEDGQDPFQLSIEPEIQARARSRRAHEFYNAGRYEHAVSEYRRALDLAPTSVEILNGLSKALFKMQRSQEAEALLKKAQQLDPDNELINCKLDVLAMTAWADKPMEEREFEAVPASSVARIEKEATTGRAAFPDTGIEPEPVLKMPELSNLWDKGNSPTAGPTDSTQPSLDRDPAEEDGMNLEEALLHYRKAVRMEPRDSDAQYNLGNIYFSLGAFHSAIDCYQAAGKINPLFGQVYNNMGVAYYELGHLGKAGAAWRQALKADPSLQSAKRNLLNLGLEETESNEPASESVDKDRS